MFKRILARLQDALPSPLDLPKKSGRAGRYSNDKGQAYRSILDTRVVNVKVGHRRRVQREFSYHATKGWRGRTSLQPTGKLLDGLMYQNRAETIGLLISTGHIQRPLKGQRPNSSWL